MSKEVNMVTVDAIEDVMKSEFANAEIVQWHGIDVEIKKSIDLHLAYEFVNQVVNSCFDEDDGGYIPEIKDFAIRACTVEKYTNITLPENVEKLYDLMYMTDIYDLVRDKINRKQLNALVRAVDDKIEYRTDSGIMVIRKAADDVRALTKQFANLFGGVTPDDVQAITKAVIDGRLDEEKLVKAYAKVKAETPDPVEADIVVPKIPMEPEKRDAIRRAIDMIMNEEQSGDGE